jgi:hypothetical protein
MSEKTLKKLEEICNPHGVEFDADNSFGDWSIYFYAPPKKCWVSSTVASVFFEHENIRTAISFIRKELEEGFFDASEDTLRATGQLDEEGEQ